MRPWKFSWLNSEILSNWRPLRTDEILPKQSYKKFNEVTPQLAANNVTKKTDVITTEKSSSREKKEKKREKDRDGKKKSKRNISDNEPDLLGTPVKHQKEHKHKKEKKDKKVKEKKLKDSKTGYEEAIGISTPSKEVY